MRKFLGEWGVPVGLFAAWGVAAAVAVHALTGMQSSTIPVVTAPAVATTAGKPQS